MRYLKITDVVGQNGIYDYKGLDIDLFVAGSQIYPEIGGYAVMQTIQNDIPDHADIEVLTEAQYESEREDFIHNKPLTPEEAVRRDIDLIKLALEELILNGGGF